MISFVGNRPALQIGPCQVIDYDLSWLEEAVMRAAKAADQSDFPMAVEICEGVELYLEEKCQLRLMKLEELFERLRKMLIQVGCQAVADQLQPLAPPVTFSLKETATSAGNGFELAFFEALREEMTVLYTAGASEVNVTGLRESALILSGQEKWNRHCDQLLGEIEQFLENLFQDREKMQLSLDQ